MALVIMYIYDSAHLLYYNEIIFIRTFSSWKFKVTNGNPFVAGRWFFIKNIIAPHSYMCRLAWNPNDNVRHSIHKRKKAYELRLTCLMPVRYVSIILFIITLLLLAALLVKVNDEIFLAILSGIYSCVLIIVLIIFILRKKIRLELKEFLKIAFEFVACPAFAINATSRLSQYITTGIPALTFAIENLDQKSNKTLANIISLRISDVIDFLDEDDVRRLNYIKYKKQVEEILLCYRD